MDRNTDLERAIARARVRDCMYLRSQIPSWTTVCIVAQLFVDDWNLEKHKIIDNSVAKAYRDYLQERCDILSAELKSRGLQSPLSADNF